MIGVVSVRTSRLLARASPQVTAASWPAYTKFSRHRSTSHFDASARLEPTAQSSFISSCFQSLSPMIETLNLTPTMSKDKASDEDLLLEEPHGTSDAENADQAETSRTRSLVLML